MGEDSCEMHSEDEKALLEKNKKRIVKTPAQVDALEKFYNEHKYPSEPMKIQVAESIGLTEKQVSGWFCHRRLKDKKLKNGEINNTTGRSSGVIQDRTSGHRQDSCGSTKQGEDRNFETREVESGRLNPKEYSAVDPTHERGSHFGGNHNRTEDASSGSSSSLRNMSNNQNGSPFDAAISRYPIPKFLSSEVKSVKARPGPSGYLKLKGQVENVSVTAVKRQLGKHYREDGPPLGVDFDPLPPGAFESSVQEPTEENYDSGEAVLPTSPDVSKIRRKFGKACEYKPIMASNNSEIDGASFKSRRKYETSDGYIPENFRVKTSLPNSGGSYYPRRNSSVELAESGARDIPNMQPYRGKVREERAESWSRKYNDVSTKIPPLGENSENEYFNMRTKGNQFHNPEDKGLSRQMIKDGKIYHDRRMINENRVNIPSNNDFFPFNIDMADLKRRREEYNQKYPRLPPVVSDNLPPTYQVIRSAAEMPSSFSEDEESAETSSSMD